MIKMLNKYKNVTGLFWWWMEYNAKGTSLSGWYNAPLFDSRTGRATSALSSLKDFDPDNTGVNDIIFDYNTSKATDSRWFNLQGQEVNQPLKPGLYINNGHKVLVK
jgi:arabinogalactan endo-1,4-beta-galactosidase